VVAGDRADESWRTSNPAQGLHHIHGSLVFWGHPDRGPIIYVWGEADWLRAFTFNGSTFNTVPVDTSTMTTPALSMPGAILSLSANGSAPGTGILWASHPTRDDANHAMVDGILRAFDASNLQNELWNSERRKR